MSRLMGAGAAPQPKRPGNTDIDIPATDVSDLVLRTGRSRRGVARNTLRQRKGATGAALVLAIGLLALIGPFVTPYSPTDSIMAPFSAPSWAHWLGSDVVGRDLLSRLLSGGYSIVILAVASTLSSVLVGSLLGCVAAMSGRVGDELIMRPLDVLMSFPLLVLGLLFLSVLGDHLWLVALTIFLGHMPHVARTCRAAAVAVKNTEFVQYATALGDSRRTIVVREVFPNIVGVILVEFGIRIGYSIAVVVGLGFIGFGPPPPSPDWGGMISENLVGLLSQPWAVAAPIVCIGVLALGANLMTDAVAAAVSREDS